MKDFEDKVNDQDWLLSNLDRPPTFLDRLRFYLYTRFNRRPYKSFRCISIKGGFLPKLFLYNGLVNSKYNILTFIPLVLYSQFSSFINLFYLAMCLSQLVPVLRVESPIVHMFPLSLVIFVYSLKEGIEDYKRHVRDKEHNRQQFCYFSDKGYVDVASEKIKLGQLLMLKQGERVPADILLLKTSEPNGASFVRTDQLDGETDWKLKRAVATTQAMSVEDIFNLLSVATVEEPKPDFYNFLGKITFYYPVKSEDERPRGGYETDNANSDLVISRSSSSDLASNGSITNNTNNVTSTTNLENITTNTAAVTNNHVGGSPRISNVTGNGTTTLGSTTNLAGNTNLASGADNYDRTNSMTNVKRSSSSNLARGNSSVKCDKDAEFTTIGVKSLKYDLVVESLNVDNVVWMNSIVASGTIHGLVIYIGKDARACLNSKRSRTKFGLFERELNRLFIILIVLMLGMTIIMLAPTGFEAKWYVTFLKYLLLFSTIVPLSLRISLDIAKYVYNRAIVMDKKIPKAMPRTTMIPEELGRIQYLLSDKTGTLTQNVISLEKLYVSRGFYTNEDVGVIKSKMDSFLRPPSNTATTPPNSLGNLTTIHASASGRGVGDKTEHSNRSHGSGVSVRGSGVGTSTSIAIGNQGSARGIGSSRGNVAATGGGGSVGVVARQYEGASKDSSRHDETGGPLRGASLEGASSARALNDRDEKEVIRDIFGANLGDSLESRLCLSLLSLGICHNVRPILSTEDPKPQSPAVGTTAATKNTNTDERETNMGTREDAVGSPTRVGYHGQGLESNSGARQDKDFGVVTSRSNMGEYGLNDSASADGSDRAVGGAKSEKEEDNVEFQASSPDEIALVKFAHLCGFKLVHRDDYCMRLLVNGLLLEFKILFMIPFSSETKRMGIIVEDSCGGKHFFIKGAEVVIIPFLLPRGSVWLSEECDNLARLGLRTLVFAYRPISDHEFTVFMAKYREANVSLEDRVKKIRNVQSTLEHGLTLVGLTGVRDQLQRNVAATLESLRNAGIKIWMLTGDKIDTAKCVAISAGLKQRHHTVYQISVESLVNPLINPSDTSKKHPERVEKEVIDFINSFDRTAHAASVPQARNRWLWRSGARAAHDGPNFDRPESEYPGERERYEACMKRVASVIEWNLEHFSMGPADSVLILDSFVLSVALDRLRKLLLKSSTLASSVLCCRCTPQMKADIVKLLKTNKQIVCCIGDGDNDVPMITEANVGIGIVGKEGLQASLSSDYSLVEFSHLKRLLLWHGRNSYKRSSKMSQFLMHRGVIISVMQAIFSSIYYFIPIAFFQGWLLVGFTSYYNMIPIFCLVLDVEICEEDVMLFPELYHELRRGRVMNVKTFLIWIWISLFQGTVLMTGAIILFENSLVSLIAIGCTSLFILEILNLVAELNSWHRLTIIGIMCTSVVYFYSLLVFRNNFDMEFIARKSFFWKIWVISFLGWVPVYAVKWLTNLLKPPQYVKLIVS
ncbi:cation transporting ATPase [Theileria orientalis strain Shintoku]|uniref:Phospholipid-transporting ATPase n=1 Tax=Theileria orientalis strain Shintoku TaxID=869250 RepID=J4DPE0_THEOR|nr:cation transporting ATPase [Theileria orientalis strain Shintoku]PVC52609.1 cation transporting ATPase [Theileria orientalis]BAM40539.1 cation transporting ATPase [Theileria orientalis strain Shintoku]|eukprot:XP_009690840.1 cation transporting ATPase [Theileria orientalis strain Shintoku]